MDYQELIPETFFTEHMNLIKGNNLLLPQSISSSYYDIKLMAKSIFFYYKKNNYEKIICNNPSEGLSASYLFYINNLIKILVNEYNILIETFVYLSGCFFNQSNINLYKEHCKNYNLYELEIKFINTFESLAWTNATENFDLINKKSLEKKNKEKLFLCFNGLARPHRVILIGELFARDLFNHTFLSCYDPELLSNLKMIEKLVKTNTYSDKFYRIFYEIYKRKDLFPLKLSQPEGQTCTHDYSIADHNLYDRSYISIVTETDFFQTFFQEFTVSFNCTYATEKTFKPIKARHPFIIVSRPHFLKHLREAGYKTFHPYIDESYDDIENDEERMNAILDEMERLSKYSNDEWINFLSGVNEICQHNFDTLMKADNMKVLNE